MFRYISLILCSLAIYACTPSTDTTDEGEIEDVRAALGLVSSEFFIWKDEQESRDTLTFTGVRIFQDGAVLGAEEMRLSGIDAQDGLPGFQSLNLSNGQIDYTDGSARFDSLTLNDPEPGLVAEFRGLLTGQATYTDGFPSNGFGQLIITGLTLETVNETEGSTRFSAERLDFGEFDGETMQTAMLTGLRLDRADTVSLAIDALEVEGLVLTQSQALTGMDSWADAVQSLLNPDQATRIDLTGLVGELPGLQIELPRYALDQFIEDNGDIVTLQTLPSLTLTPSGKGGGDFGDALTRLGYEAVNFSYEFGSRLDPETGRMSREGENVLRMRDGFELHLHHDLVGGEAYAKAYSNFLANGGQIGQMPPEAVLNTLTIHELSLRFEDQSLVSRIISDMARAQGVSEAQIRAQSSLMLSLGLAFIAGDWPSDLANQTLSALSSLINEGGSLVLEVSPEGPVSGAILSRGTSAEDLAAAGTRIRHESADP
jgi:hypothetical protein